MVEVDRKRLRRAIDAARRGHAVPDADGNIVGLGVTVLSVEQAMVLVEAGERLLLVEKALGAAVREPS